MSWHWLVGYRRQLVVVGGFVTWGHWNQHSRNLNMTFGGTDLYPTVVDKAAALGFSLIANHTFVDGNKRTGHAVRELFLVLNGYEIAASVDEQEQVLLAVASGTLDRAGLMAWLAAHIVPIEQG